MVGVGGGGRERGRGLRCPQWLGWEGLNKIDGNHSSLALAVFCQVPEYDTARLQNSQTVSTAEP